MSLYQQLQQRAADNKPIRVALIGAGKFGAMYLAQVPRTPGVHLLGIADLSIDNARANLARVGWPAHQSTAASIDDAVKQGLTYLTQDWQALVSHPLVDVVVECTGNPIAAVEHCLAAFAHGKHVVNVTVGPMRFAARCWLAKRLTPVWCIPWRLATNRHSFAIWWTGPAPAAFRSRPPVAATNGCRISASPPLKPSGAITA
jgi:threonine dehydrogenase-like Zn-dependent dehydrogenase